jgi:hypothetical protein
MDLSTVLRKRMASSTFLNVVQSDSLRLTANQNADLPSRSIRTVSYSSKDVHANAHYPRIRFACSHCSLGIRASTFWMPTAAHIDSLVYALAQSDEKRFGDTNLSSLVIKDLKALIRVQLRARICAATRSLDYYSTVTLPTHSDQQ